MSNDGDTVYKFLILIFIINVYASGMNIWYIVSMIILLFISLKVIRGHNMSRDLDNEEHIEDVLQYEEDALQREIEELNKRRDRLKNIKDLKDKRYVIEEEMDYIKGKKKRISFDQITFFDIMLFVVLVLLAGALLAEGRIMGRYAIIPLIVAMIIAWKLIDRFV